MKTKVGNKNETDFSNNVIGRNVDFSGSILDDKMENLIDEDEENNFYGLGGDNHKDPDKDKKGRRVRKHPPLFMLTIV